MNCQTLTADELDNTFFGSGKKQQLKAIAICQTCPVKRECLQIAKNQGDAWGVFGSYAFRDGTIVRGPNDL